MARGAQDNTGAAFGGAGAQVSSTTIAGTPTTGAAATTSQASSGTLVESKDPPATRLVSGSRKVMAVIGGLVIVALALMILTIRYWRVTKPIASEPVDAGEVADLAVAGVPVAPIVGSAAGEPAAAAPAPVTPAADDDDIWTTDEPDAGEPTVPVAPPAAVVAAADAVTAADAAEPVTTADAPDHAGADQDWEPHTGEHERVEVPTGAALAKPGASARRRALGLPDDA